MSDVQGRETVEAWTDSDRRDVADWLVREADQRVKFFPQRRDGVDALIRHVAAALRAAGVDAAPEPLRPDEWNALRRAHERDAWAREWNPLPTAIDRVLAARQHHAAPEPVEQADDHDHAGPDWRCEACKPLADVLRARMRWASLHWGTLNDDAYPSLARAIHEAGYLRAALTPPGAQS